MTITNSHLKARVYRGNRIVISADANATYPEERAQLDVLILEVLSRDILNLMNIIEKMKQLEEKCDSWRRTGDEPKFEEIQPPSIEVTEISNIHHFKIGEFTLTKDFNQNTLNITGGDADIFKLEDLMRKRKLQIDPNSLMKKYQTNTKIKPWESIGLKEGELKATSYYDSQNMTIYIDPQVKKPKDDLYQYNNHEQNDIISNIKSSIDHRKESLLKQQEKLKKKSFEYQMKQKKLGLVKSDFNVLLFFVTMKLKNIREEENLIATKLLGLTALQTGLEENEYDFSKATEKVKREIQCKSSLKESVLFKHRQYTLFLPDEIREKTSTEITFQQVKNLTKTLQTKSKCTFFLSQKEQKSTSGKKPRPQCAIT